MRGCSAAGNPQGVTTAMPSARAPAAICRSKVTSVAAMRSSDGDVQRVGRDQRKIEPSQVGRGSRDIEGAQFYALCRPCNPSVEVGEVHPCILDSRLAGADAPGDR